MEDNKLKEFCQRAGCRLENYTPGKAALLILRSGEPVIVSVGPIAIKVFTVSKIHLLNWFVQKMGIMPFFPRTVGSWKFRDFIGFTWLSASPFEKFSVQTLVLASLVKGLTAYNSISDLREDIRKVSFDFGNLIREWYKGE